MLGLMNFIVTRGWACAPVLLAFVAVTQPALGQVSVALTGDVPSVDASQDSSPIGYNVRLNLYDQLTEIREDGSLSPRLATAWESSKDAMTWTFTIRPGVKFHDGSPLTPSDVVWNYEKILADLKAPTRTFLSKVKSVEMAGDDKVRFHLKEPFAIFDRQVVFVSILSRKAYESMGAEKFGQSPVGSGPYKFVRWIKDDRIEFEAFDAYWRGKPKLAKAILRPIPADASRASALISGDVDIVPSVPPALFDNLASRAGIKAGKAEGFRVMFLGFNDTHPLLGDHRLRLAIDHAIDRTTITSKLLRGLGVPAGQIVPPVNFGYDKNIEPTAYDPAKARELVKQTSYKGEKIPFQYPSNNFALASEVAQAIAGYLGAVGINVELQPMEYTAFFPAWANRKMSGIYYFAFGSSLYDADSSMSALYETGSRIYTVDPQIDSLARAARAEMDPEKRKAIFSQIFRLNKEKGTYVLLYNEVQAYGVKDGLNWKPRPDGFVRFYEIAP
jgi:peptide/nickel transport system substrate-binding protein